MEEVRGVYAKERPSASGLAALLYVGCDSIEECKSIEGRSVVVARVPDCGCGGVQRRSRSEGDDESRLSETELLRERRGRTLRSVIAAKRREVGWRLEGGRPSRTRRRLRSQMGLEKR